MGGVIIVQTLGLWLARQWKLRRARVGSWLLMLVLGVVLALLWAKLTNNLEPLQSHFSKAAQPSQHRQAAHLSPSTICRAIWSCRDILHQVPLAAPIGNHQGACLAGC